MLKETKAWFHMSKVQVLVLNKIMGKALPSNQLEIFWQKCCEKTNFLGGNAMVWSILA